MEKQRIYLLEEACYFKMGESLIAKSQDQVLIPLTVQQPNIFPFFLFFLTLLLNNLTSVYKTGGNLTN